MRQATIKIKLPSKLRDRVDVIARRLSKEVILTRAKMIEVLITVGCITFERIGGKDAALFNQIGKAVRAGEALDAPTCRKTGRKEMGDGRKET